MLVAMKRSTSVSVVEEMAPHMNDGRHLVAVPREPLETARQGE